jgi:hypothetical protein
MEAIKEHYVIDCIVLGVAALFINRINKEFNFEKWIVRLKEYSTSL